MGKEIGRSYKYNRSKLFTPILKKAVLSSSADHTFLYLMSLVDMVSVPLTEGNNRNFARGSPTTLSFVFNPLLALLGNPTKAAQLKITVGI